MKNVFCSDMSVFIEYVRSKLIKNINDLIKPNVFQDLRYYFKYNYNNDKHKQQYQNDLYKTKSKEICYKDVYCLGVESINLYSLYTFTYVYIFDRVIISIHFVKCM